MSLTLKIPLFLFLLALPLQAIQAAKCDPKSFKDSFDCVLNQIRPDTGIAEKEPLEVILTIVRTGLTLTAIIGVIGLIIAGAMYIFSGVDEGLAKKAKGAIFYVVIGLIIIGLAILIVNLVIGAFGKVAMAAADKPFTPLKTDELGIPSQGKLTDYILRIVNAGLGLVGIAAGVFLVIAGVRYVTSHGDETETKKAKNAILYAVLGLLIIGLAALVVNFVISSFGKK